ncbi:MAG: AI-2E family transporter [Candidatus Cloacimonadaceae bacterium]
MKLTRWIMYLVILALLIVSVMFYSWVLKYLLISIIFAYILNPWVTWLERKHIPRLLGIFMVYIVIALAIVWVILRFIPVIVNEAQGLITFLKTSSLKGDAIWSNIPFMQDLMDRVTYWDKQVPILHLQEHFINLVNAVEAAMMHIPDFLIRNYQKILQAVSMIVTVPLIGFFLLKDNVRFRKDFLKLIPNRYFEIAVILLHKIDEVVGKYLRAIFYEVLIVGSLSAIVLTILGIPYSVLIGFFAGFANVIPYFGPWLGGFLAVMAVLISGMPPILMVYVALGMYLVQLVDNNLVYPLVIGTSIEMHPLFVLLTVLAGGWAFGLVGMLVSVPIVYLVYSIINVLYINLKAFKMI